jgi:hypothetical protein
MGFSTNRARRNRAIRNILEINADKAEATKAYRAVIKTLDAERVTFQKACPHPKELRRTTSNSDDDEYGKTIGYTLSSECLCCGTIKYVSVDTNTEASRFGDFTKLYPSLNE